MKRLFALALAIMLVMSLATTAFAAEDDTFALSFTHIAGNHTFTAYQIFDGNLSGSVLSDIVWGSGVAHAGNTANNDDVKTDDLITNLKADTTVIKGSEDSTGVAPEYTMANEFANAAATADGIATVMKNWASDSVRLDYFAEFIGTGKGLTAENDTYLATGTVSTGTGTYDANTGRYTYTIENLDPGYYIIIDTTPSVNGNDFRTKYMLQITRDTDIRTKGSYSTVTKEIYNDQTERWEEHYSQHIGKEVKYQWEVDLDEEIVWYDTYKLEFVDTLSKGLKFEYFDNVYFIQNDSSRVYLYKDNSWLYQVYDKDGKLVSSDSAINVNPTTNSYDQTNNIVKLGWNDIKTAFPNVDGDHYLVVEYTATVTKDAVYGVAGNPNEVKIIFSNSPSDDGEGESIPDDAIEFNFQMNVVKVDADDVDKKLEGAKFYLYHKHGESHEYAYVENGLITDWVEHTQKSLDAEIAKINADETKTDEQKTAAINALKAANPKLATLLVSDANGNIAVKGLTDKVTYYLHEIEAPKGYNKIPTDIEINILPDYTNDDGSYYMKDGNISYHTLEFKVDGVNYVVTATNETHGDFELGQISVQVKNDAGTTLPTTGGMGTTLFYVIGSVMVLAAVVLLITKKRMAAEN